jgi:hypothetical protein
VHLIEFFERIPQKSRCFLDARMVAHQLEYVAESAGETDAAFRLSKIRMGGVVSDLWTATRNLSARPIMDPLGIIENPDRAGPSNCARYGKSRFACRARTLSEHENACESQFKVSLSNGHQSGFPDHSVKAGLDKQGK